MSRKLGVYLCDGCSIGDCVSTDALAKIARSEYKAAVVETSRCLCSREAVEKIAGDVRAGLTEAVVLGACSPRAKADAFSFDGTFPLERVNLREHVAWSHAPKDEDTQMLAEDLLRMGLARVEKTSVPVGTPADVSRRLLVVGGGVAGLTAAREGADAGYEIVLVEREAHLGGPLAAQQRHAPAQPPWPALEDGSFGPLLQAVLYHPKVTVFTGARVVSTEGQPGAFDVTIEHQAGRHASRVGAIVMATGWRPYEASRLTHLGYGLPNVVTSLEFERLLGAETLRRPADGGAVERIVFVQCAGSRDPAHLPYCSSTCCLQTLRQVAAVHEACPAVETCVVYKDIRTPGQDEQFYRAAQDHPATFMLKGQVSGVAPNAGGKLAVSVTESGLGEAIELHADLVVLAVGMVPNAADGEAIRALEDAKAKKVSAESEAQRAEATRRAAELAAHEGTQILNLAYRQGPDLPVLRDGFPDSHFVCFPYETRRTGVYAAGAVRAPMDARAAREDALGATLKAIQCVEMAARGAAVLPRAGDTSFPSFLLQRCTQCKRCTEECPFGALDEDAKGTPKPNVGRCRRCGICMGACPERIVSFADYSVDIISSMIKAVEVPEDEDKPRVLAFMCENDAYPALDLAGFSRLRYDASIRVIPLRCLGSLNIVWIADALSRGFDGVLLVGCKYGDDYQCHFVKGSELANRRLENVKETLQRLQLEPERIRLTELALNDYASLPGLVDEFVGRIRELGPNPYKGF